MLKPSEIAHLATFEAAHDAAKTRAEWLLNRVRTTEGGFVMLHAFDLAAEEQQRAAGKLAAARRYLGLKPE